jgi:hypothetical protein
MKKEDEMGEYWKNTKLYYRVPDIIPPIEDPNDNINRSFAYKMPDSVSQTAKSASTMEEQVQPLQNGVSSACSSPFMVEHHYFSEDKKEEKQHNFRDTHQRER